MGVRYPSQTEGLKSLTIGDSPTFDVVPKDPWGEEYIYFLPARNPFNAAEFEVISKGPDRAVGTADDVASERLQVPPSPTPP